MILYHADRSGQLSEGMPLRLKTDFTLNNEKQAIFHECFPEGLSMHGIHYAADQRLVFQVLSVQITPSSSCPCVPLGYIGDAHSLLGNTICEYQFELVRKAFFPHNPSRFQSVFAVEKMDDFMQWEDTGIGKDCAVYEIETNDLYRFDSTWLRGGLSLGPVERPSYLGFSPSINLDLALNYWKGNSSPSPRWEYIIPLPAVVGRRVR